jgi:hypothetical protein
MIRINSECKVLVLAMAGTSSRGAGPRHASELDESLSHIQDYMQDPGKGSGEECLDEIVDFIAPRPRAEM